MTLSLLLNWHTSQTNGSCVYLYQYPYFWRHLTFFVPKCFLIAWSRIFNDFNLFPVHISLYGSRKSKNLYLFFLNALLIFKLFQILYSFQCIILTILKYTGYSVWKGNRFPMLKFSVGRVSLSISFTLKLAFLLNLLFSL